MRLTVIKWWIWSSSLCLLLPLFTLRRWRWKQVRSSETSAKFYHGTCRHITAEQIPLQRSVSHGVQFLVKVKQFIRISYHMQTYWQDAFYTGAALAGSRTSRSAVLIAERQWMYLFFKARSWTETFRALSGRHNPLHMALTELNGRPSSFSPRRTGFNIRAAHVGFLVDELIFSFYWLFNDAVNIDDD